MQRPFILDSWMRLRALWLALVLSATMVHAAGFVVPDLPLITTDGTLYRVTLWRDGDPAKSTVITGALNDLDASGKAVHPQGRVTVAVTPVTPTETRWSISVDPAEGYGVYEVAFPLLVLKPVPGGKPEHLALPRGYGALMEDVYAQPERKHGRRPRLLGSTWFGTYGSKDQSLQMICYGNGDRGVMLWTPDPALFIKDFVVKKALAPGYKKRGLRATVQHFPANTGQPGVGWHAPYPVVTTHYEGGWHSAAKRYRAWALQQSWCADGPIVDRIRRGDLPEWFGRNALWTTAINTDYYDRMLALRAAFPGVEIGVFYSQWQRWAFDHRVPEYFPPKDEGGHRRMMTLQKQGIHMFPYMNVHLCHLEYEPMRDKFQSAFMVEPPTGSTGWLPYPEYWGWDPERSSVFRARLRQAWSGPIDQRLVEEAEQHPGYPYQKRAAVKQLREAWGRKDAPILQNYKILNSFAPLCPGSKLWRDAYVGMAHRNLLHYGASGQYVDQATAGMYVCFAKDHGHPPGFGSHYFRDLRTLLARIREGHPEKIVFGECVHEGTVGVIQENYTVHPDPNRSQVIPLFATVYHGYTSMHECPIFAATLKDLKNFAAALASSVHLGQKVGSFTTATTWMALMKPENRKALKYLQALVQMKLRTMDEFAYGERLRDPLVTGSPSHEITRYQNKPGTRFTKRMEPVVQASCWRSLTSSKRTVLVLSNTSDQNVSVNIRTDEIPVGTMLTDLRGRVIAYGPGLSIVLEPFSWRTLRTKAKKDVQP